MLKICITSAELVPFSKTGGLGDVATALSAALHRAGHEVRVFSPLYGSVNLGEREATPVEALQDVPLTLGRRELSVSVFSVELPGSETERSPALRVDLVHCPELYHRPGIYSDGWDEPLRFAALSQAALECCQRLGWRPDIVHAHDWHAALQPLYLKTLYAGSPSLAAARTVLTIHNIAYQGVCSSDLLPDLGLAADPSLLHHGDLAAGRINLLRTGILYADALTTVSRTHAHEIQSPEGGFGLDELLRSRSEDLVGIVNGIDDTVWDPATDPLIPYRFSARDLTGKTRTKRHLLEEQGLTFAEGVPLLGIVSRLTSQKGFDLALGPLAERLAGEDLRLVALGTGEAELEDRFRRLQERFPDQVRFVRAYDEGLAHSIEAGADVFLMPSRYEPCGLNQMYSMRYGTLPVVHKTGGLADTVEPWNPETGEGTGFVFEHADEEGFRWALGLALETWKQPDRWRRLQHNAMARDFSWDHQTRHYVELYERLAGG